MKVVTDDPLDRAFEEADQALGMGYFLEAMVKRTREVAHFSMLSRKKDATTHPAEYLETKNMLQTCNDNTEKRRVAPARRNMTCYEAIGKNNVAET